MLTRKTVYLAVAAVSLLVAVMLAVYIFNLGVVADSSTKNVVLPIWAVVLAALAVVSFLVFLIKWGLLRRNSTE